MVAWRAHAGVVVAVQGSRTATISYPLMSGVVGAIGRVWRRFGWVASSRAGSIALNAQFYLGTCAQRTHGRRHEDITHV